MPDALAAGRPLAARRLPPSLERTDVSQVGSQVSAIALPFVAIVALDASAFSVAALGAVEMLPFLLIALPAGVWVDRLPRRPILIAGDLGRAVALGSIPLAWALDVLTIWQLYAVGFVVGVFTVFFDVAYQSFLPSLVAREPARRRELEAGGQPLGGADRRARASAACSSARSPRRTRSSSMPISFLWSALLVLRIRGREERIVPTEAPNMKRELIEGVRYIVGDRALACDLALRLDGQLLLGARVLDPPRVRGAGASPLRRRRSG